MFGPKNAAGAIRCPIPDYYASCAPILGGCAPGGTGNAAGLVAANDYSATNIKGDSGNPAALPSTPAENFSLYPGSDGICGVYDKFDFYTSDGGNNCSVYTANGSGAEVGTCYPKTDAGA